MNTTVSTLPTGNKVSSLLGEAKKIVATAQAESRDLTDPERDAIYSRLDAVKELRNGAESDPARTPSATTLRKSGTQSARLPTARFNAGPFFPIQIRKMETDFQPMAAWPSLTTRAVSNSSR